MVAHATFGSPSFKQVAKGLVELHRLIAAGQDETPEAESVRDALDAPLKALQQIEKERAQWLSEDLYSVSEPSAAPPQNELTPQVWQRLSEAIDARQRREWDRALALLRPWMESASPALLSYIRGSIWSEAGYPDVAAVFYRHATDCDPANANYKALYMHSLSTADPDAAGQLAQAVLLDVERQAPLSTTG